MVPLFFGTHQCALRAYQILPYSPRTCIALFSYRPWTEADQQEQKAERELKERSEKVTEKRRSRLNVFRSIGGSSSSRQHPEEERTSFTAIINGSNGMGRGGGAAPDGQEKKRAFSPSLPINKNPSASTAEKLRKKLISPPPPSPSLPSSPERPKVTSTAQASSASSSQQKLDDGGLKIPKPIAVRKPLSFETRDNYFDVDPNTQAVNVDEEEKPVLRVPEVVSSSRLSTPEENPAKKILDWKGNDEREESDGEENDMEEEDEEEDLNEECVCPDCENVMVASLSQSKWDGLRIS
jgi:hypothetical protein